MIRDRTDEWDMMTPAERSLRKEEAAFAKREQRDAELAGARQAAYDRATADAVARLRAMKQKWQDDSDEFRKRHGDPENHMASPTADHWMSIATGIGYAADALERREHVGAATSGRICTASPCSSPRER